MAGISKVRFPFGEADLKALAYAATQAVTIDNAMTILSFAILTGACTVNLTIDSEVPIGSTLQVVVPATATEVLTFGTGFTATTITGVAGKTKTQGFVYDGTTFKPVGTAVQIN